MTPWERLKALQLHTSTDALNALIGGTSLDALELMSECVVGGFTLPLSMITGVCVFGVDHCVAMCTEEPSVVAAANAGSALFSRAGGVTVEVKKPVTRAQIVIIAHDVMEAPVAAARLMMKRNALLKLANDCDPGLKMAGGDAFALEFECIQDACVKEAFIVGKLDVHTVDAMGANIVNTMAEILLQEAMKSLNAVFPAGVFEPGMAILTNDGEGRMAKARIELPLTLLDNYKQNIPGDELARRIELASKFALVSPERAVTHNKGILNGIFAVETPLGQDTRAQSAAALNYACRTGSHKPLSFWNKVDDKLVGEICMPVVVGLVGGARHALESIDAAYEAAQIDDYETLCGVILAVGLAQNFSALAALTTEGIQAGHMKLHARKQLMQRNLKES